MGNILLKQMIKARTLISDDVSYSLEHLSTSNIFWWNLNHWWCVVSRKVLSEVVTYKRFLKRQINIFYH